MKILAQSERDGIALKHAIEVRHPSFVAPEFVALVRRYGATIVCAEHPEYPMIADVTGEFVYARLQEGADDNPHCYPDKELDALGRPAEALGGWWCARRPAAPR